LEEFRLYMSNLTAKHLVSSLKGKMSGAGSLLSLMLAYLVICIVLSFMSPYFFTVENFLNIGIYSSIVSIMAAGLTVTMILGGLDISQYATATLAAIVVGMMAREDYPPLFIILIALMSGLICGAINGIFVTKLRISPIITTLATMQIFRGIAFLITNGNNIMIRNEFFLELGRGYTLGMPNTILLMIIVNALVFYILKYTIFGRNVYLVGGNSNASYLSGIKVNRTRLGALIFSGLSAALGGILLASHVGVTQTNSGMGSEMDIIAAVILGGISLSGGKGSIFGTIIGVLILATISNGMTILGVQPYYQMITRGCVLALAVLLDSLRSGNK